MTPTDPSARPSRLRFLRSFWFWAFVLGIGFLTAIRPYMRHVPDPPKALGPAPEWSLTDQTGGPFGTEQLKGSVYVVGFFFTSCVTVCPHLQAAMKQLQDRFASRELPIRLVSVSVDPETDEPEVLTRYAEALGADLDRWTFITGSEEGVRSVVVDGFKTYMGQKEELPDRPGVFDVGHGGRLIVVDGDGQVRGHYEVLSHDDDQRSWAVDEQGVDEVFHRSKRVFEAARQTSSTPFSCSAGSSLH